MDNWLKRIWLINGIALFVVFIYALVNLVSDQFTRVSPTPSGPLSNGQPSSSRPDSMVSQDVFLDHPMRVGRTDYVYIGIGVYDFTTSQPKSTYRTLEFSDPYATTYTNLLFIQRGRSFARLLVDRKAYISFVDLPTYDDSLQEYGLYKISFHDTNGDGRINSADINVLYVSDLDGKNLAPILPEDLHYVDYSESSSRETISIRATSRPADSRILERDWPQRLYVFHVRSRQLTPYPVIDSAVTKAKEILWGK